MKERKLKKLRKMKKNKYEGRKKINGKIDRQIGMQIDG